jgi:hypothetical protein
MANKILRVFDAVMRAKSDAKMEVEGYALKFGKATQIGNKRWGWLESIAKTALNEADLGDVVFNVNHNMTDILAGTRNESLELIPDDTGLKIVARIADTSIGRDTFTLIKDGLICRMSFMAVIKSSEWTWADDSNPDDMDKREITSFGKFYDVSAVTFPAYEDTPLAARSLAAEMKEREKIVYERQMSRIKKIIGGK